VISGARNIAPATNRDYDLAPPRASTLIESLRAFGYELPTAIADLVDNSITAEARNIWIDFHWAGADSVIALTDDGVGMSTDQLVAAMRLGSRNPLELRHKNDLGRFGLGLKTASFSQCRRLTVRTRGDGADAVTRCWDLDHIARADDWQLLRGADSKGEGHLERIERLRHGTTVLWQKLDRLTAPSSVDDEKQQQAFLDHAEKVRQHLGVVFHLLMTESPAVKIILNGHPITAWNPYLLNETATQILAATKLRLRRHTVEVRPYILPHQSKISRAVFDAAAGPRGWTAHQGFYVYRNRRLLVPGDWLGFGWSKEENYKLARILVEIPNALDHDWQIDVTKSRAIPPPALREELRRIGVRTRAEAKRIYSHRGAKLATSSNADRVFTWEPVVRHGKVSYRLNREHPLLKRAQSTSTDRAAFAAFLRLVEETVPYPHITFENSERPGSLAGPFDHVRESDVRQIMEQVYDSLVATGYGTEDAINRLRTISPFELFPSILETIREAKSHG
jgi:hypothetical protein